LTTAEQQITPWATGNQFVSMAVSEWLLHAAKLNRPGHQDGPVGSM
jgi:hypothetical protein